MRGFRILDFLDYLCKLGWVFFVIVEDVFYEFNKVE